MLPAQRQAGSDAIVQRILALPLVQQAPVVACYLSFGLEVATHALVTALLARGHRVVVPVMLKNVMVMQPLASLADCHTNRWGILEPLGPSEGAATSATAAATTPVSGDGLTPGDEIGVCLTPGLAFSMARERLGRGGGHYDRWFAHHPQVHRIGLAFEAQLVPRLPSESHDLPMHHVITESRLI